MSIKYYNDMRIKYYKVIKDNFLWEDGAILCLNSEGSTGEGYSPINDIFKKHECNEYITANIVEESPDYFERVYKVDLATRIVYETKEKAKELIAGLYKN